MILILLSFGVEHHTILLDIQKKHFTKSAKNSHVGMHFYFAVLTTCRFDTSEIFLAVLTVWLVMTIASYPGAWVRGYDDIASYPLFNVPGYEAMMTTLEIN